MLSDNFVTLAKFLGSRMKWETSQPDGSKNVVLYYVDDCVYWYTNEDLGKWFVDTLGNIPCELLGIFTLVHVNNNFSV